MILVLLIVTSPSQHEEVKYEDKQNTTILNKNNAECDNIKDEFNIAVRVGTNSLDPVSTHSS
jgi:hypothetical protein